MPAETAISYWAIPRVCAIGAGCVLAIKEVLKEAARGAEGWKDKLKEQ